jgi:hypothetical protein
MSFLALIMWAVITGSTVIQYWNQPLDIDLVEQVSTPQGKPLLEWKATRYDYKLGNEWRSKNHDTCALRIRERYGKYKVCVWDKCITCYHNDYWPAEYTNKVIDLSSHAFKQLAPLSRWVIEVKIYKVNE